MTVQGSVKRDEAIIAAKSSAPFPILMAVFMLIYAVWFGLAWGLIGWAVFALLVVYAGWLIFHGVSAVHAVAQLPQPEPTPEVNRIGKQMQILSALTYIPLWIVIILLAVFSLQRYIMPALTLIIGMHFVPQAKIFHRTIDYCLAPLAIVATLAAFYIALTTNASWQMVYAVSGIGGALATAGYGLYMVMILRRLIREIDQV
ncbi:MAG: hypothetical protein ACFNUR_01845 [Candidatus Saccharibacteria bacterium]|jgi:hypothetical protein